MYKVLSFKYCIPIALNFDSSNWFGVFTLGLFLRLPIFGKVQRDHLFDDHPSWELPEETMENAEGHPMILISVPQEIKL